MEEMLDPDGWGVAFCLTSLGGLYNEIGEYDKAKPLLERESKISQKLLNEDAEPAERKIRFSSLASRETYGLIRMQTGTQNTPPLIPPLPTALLVVSDC